MGIPNSDGMPKVFESTTQYTKNSQETYSLPNSCEVVIQEDNLTNLHACHNTCHVTCKENDSLASHTCSPLHTYLKEVNVQEVERNKSKDVSSMCQADKKEKSKVHKCPYAGCNALFARPWRLAAHICSHTGEKPYRCCEENCTRSYTTLAHLKRHNIEVHQQSNLSDSELICPVVDCCKKFKSKEAVKLHYKRFHTGNKKIYTCSHCNVDFSSEKRLIHHQTKCIAEAPFRCKKCNVVFMDVNLWKRHIQCHKKSVFVCHEEDCNEQFHQFKLLCQHTKLKHPRRMDCTSCEKSFVNSSALHAHMQTHVNVSERRTFCCTYSGCSRSYTKKSNLEQHIRSAHEGYRIQCSHPDCTKDFVTKQKLEYHLKLHESNNLSVRKQTVRRQRKDAGIPKKSMAVKLAGLNVAYEIEKMIVNASYSDSKIIGTFESDV